MANLKISKRTKSIAMGLIFGLLSAVCVGLYIAQLDERANAAQTELFAKYGGDQISVCVAKHDISAGDTIGEGDIETRTWIATMLPANAVVDKTKVVGRRVGSTILAGEVISESRFGFESSDIDIPDGLVAVSVPTRDVQAVGGAIDSGMTTDVYAVGAGSTALLAESVQILATSLSSDSKSGSSNAWVTLAVAPEKVQEFVTAAENLEIYLTLPSESLTEKTVVVVDDGDGAATGDASAEAPVDLRLETNWTDDALEDEDEVASTSTTTGRS